MLHIPCILALCFFLIHSLTVWISPRIAVLVTAGLLVKHSAVVREAYRDAVREKWSLESMRRLSEAGIHCVGFAVGAGHIIVRRWG